jgi:hypothetical protein
VPLLAVSVGIGLRVLSIKSDDGRRPVDSYAAGWDLMVAGSILVCETLYQLIACAREPYSAVNACTKYLRVASGAQVTPEEYIDVTVGFLMTCVLVAFLVTGLVRRFGWSRESARHWRLNVFGLVMPWICGFTMLFGIVHLRGG